MINQTRVIENEIFNLCDYNETYILVRGDITTYRRALLTQIAFKNCAPFTKCITKIDGITIDDVEDLDLVMPMYNFLEDSSDYSNTTGSLWFYSKDEASQFSNDIVDSNDFKFLSIKLNC